MFWDTLAKMNHKIIVPSVPLFLAHKGHLKKEKTAASNFWPIFYALSNRSREGFSSKCSTKLSEPITMAKRLQCSGKPAWYWG